MYADEERKITDMRLCLCVTCAKEMQSCDRVQDAIEMKRSIGDCGTSKIRALELKPCTLMKRGELPVCFYVYVSCMPGVQRDCASQNAMKMKKDKS